MPGRPLCIFQMHSRGLRLFGQARKNRIHAVFRGVAQLVERLVRDQEVARSNRVTPTTSEQAYLACSILLSKMERTPNRCSSLFRKKSRQVALLTCKRVRYRLVAYQFFRYKKKLHHLIAFGSLSKKVSFAFAKPL